MPLPEDFIDGQVLDAANVNDITETVNEIDVRVTNLEVIPFVILFAPGVTQHVLQLSDNGKILQLGGGMTDVLFRANADADFPTGSQVTVLNLRNVTVKLLANPNVFFFAITTGGDLVDEIEVPAGGIVTCVKMPVFSTVVSNWYVTGNIV